MGAAGPFLVLFAAEHPPDRSIALRALYELPRHARAIQVPARAPAALAVAAQQVDVDRPAFAVKRKPVAVQQFRPEARE
jgi:hypothetical protein